MNLIEENLNIEEIINMAREVEFEKIYSFDEIKVADPEIAQAIVNVNSGGRGRLSNFTSGAFLMVLIFLLNDFMVQIPLAALVAVMITASIATFDWDSLRNLTKMPRTDALVIVVVVAVVTVTSNLAYGVVIGLVMTAIFFAMITS